MGTKPRQASPRLSFLLLSSPVLPGSVSKYTWPSSEQLFPKSSPSRSTREATRRWGRGVWEELCIGKKRSRKGAPPQGGPLQRPGRLLCRKQHEPRRRPPPHFLIPPAGTGGRGTRAGIRGRSGRAAGLRAACARLSPPSASREENLQKNSATISALPRKVMPCSRESCSALARPTDDGTRFHPADSDARGFRSSSPPLVSKGTTQDAVAPFAQARSASRPLPSCPLRRREVPLDPALRGRVLQVPSAPAGVAVRAGAVERRGGAVPGW